MAEPFRVRPSGTRTLDLALVLLGLSLLLFAVAEYALLATSPVAPLWILALFPATAAVYGGAGLVAWHRRPGNRIGLVMIVGSLNWLLAGLINTTTPLLVAAGAIVATAPVAVVVHLLLAFPSGRVRGRLPRAIVVTAYFVTLVLQAPIYLFAPTHGPDDLLFVADRPELAAAAHAAQSSVAVGVVGLTAVVVGRRFLAADRRSRRKLGPLLLYGMLTVLFVSFAGRVLEPVFGVAPIVRAVLQIVALAGVPIAFTIAVVVGGFRQTAGIEDLGVWLGRGQGSRAGLVSALADAVGDPSVELVFWAPERHSYLDAGGHEVALPDPRSGPGTRAAVPIELGDRRVGAVIYDSTLIADAELVGRAGRVVAIAVDHERLTAEVRANEQELRGSRDRLARAADAERRRIAGDLHDGLQAELVLLAVQAYAVGDEPTASPAVRARAAELRSGLDAAATELRGLVHGLMPALLIERGLYAAAEDLVDRVPIPTTLALTGDDRGLSDVVSSTAYFAISEGLTNAVKHSGAHRLHVGLARTEGHVRIEVVDDGVGGAAPGAGLGLRSLADRLDVLAGTLRVQSEPGRGTRLEMDLPCAS